MNFCISSAPSPLAMATQPQATTAEHRKLTEAAQQFEGMLLQEMLKPMKQHGFCQGDGQDDDDSKDAGSGFGDTLSSFGTEAMATAIAKGGGLGIAKQVVKQVEGEKASRHPQPAEPVPPQFQNKTLRY
jgi:flagellar protein FlgJ